MKAFLTSTALVLATLASSSAFASQFPFAVLAYSREVGAWGYAFAADYNTAQARAMANCYSRNAPHCEVVAWTQEGCVSLSRDSNLSWGVGVAQTMNSGTIAKALSDSQSSAQMDCQQYSQQGGCAVMATVCSR